MEYTQEDLDRLMDAEPAVTNYGLGVFNQWGLSKEERAAKRKEERDLLRDNLKEVAASAAWIANAPRNKYPNCRRSESSYGLKHLAEANAGHYVSNGALIAGALLVGLTMCDKHPPNPHFNISAKWVNAERERLGNPV